MEEIGDWQSLECGELFIVHFQVRLVVIPGDYDGAGRIARQDRLRFDAGIANSASRKVQHHQSACRSLRLLTMKLAIEQIDWSFARDTPKFALATICDGRRIALAIAD